MADFITKQDLETACDDLATMPFFPQHARSSVMLQLAKMCPHREALRFVVDSAIALPGPWPGLGELRGILCSRFDPADQIDAWSTLPGYRAEDGEQRTLMEHAERKKLEEQANKPLREMLAIVAPEDWGMDWSEIRD